MKRLLLCEVAKPLRYEARVRGRRAAFTLVELMVVISIIVVLMAIALPVFSRARESARQTACMANLYQLAMAVRMYRMDMGAYPGPYDPVTGEGGLNALYPAYVGSRKVYICPDDSMDSGEKYVAQKARIWETATTYRDIAYTDLLATASSLYSDIDPDYWSNMWIHSRPNPGANALYDPAFFTEWYSSYNAMYNWVGYAYYSRDYLSRESRYQTDEEWYQKFNYSLLDLGEQQLRPGDNLAYWYMWYRWDPENALGRWSSDQTRDLIISVLQYHLAQQTYWKYYDPQDSTQQQDRLQDSLRRPLWDPGNPDSSAYDYMPYGMPSPVFPGLINRNAPENTIVTRCIHHRPYTVVKTRIGSGPSEGRGQPGGSRVSTEYFQGESPQDIVLRLDGSAALAVGINYDWAVQPQQAR
jgi:prepilin-type N-terminal cleavage/methylation domain-containing protein